MALEQESAAKRAKIDSGSTDEIPPPPKGERQCHYYVSRKRRYCHLPTKAGNKYCGEHMAVYSGDSGSISNNGNNSALKTQRIPCPYDPSHSVDLDKLKKHMSSRCNARPPAVQPEYVVRDFNITMQPPGYENGTFNDCGELWMAEGLGKADPRLMLKPGDRMYLGGQSKVFGTLSGSSNPTSAGNTHATEKATLSEIESLLRPIIKCYIVGSKALQSDSSAQEILNSMKNSDAVEESESLGSLLDQVMVSEDFPIDVQFHSVLEKQRHAKTNPKHALQQGSIVGHLSKNGLLDPRFCFLEFGAGKGELSVYVHSALEHETSKDSEFFLVDRKNYRLKFNLEKGFSDSKETDQGPGRKAQDGFRRILLDIRDLDLAKVKELQEEDPDTGERKLRPIVAYSKHLCGAATDLTLKALDAYKRAGGQVAGIAIALCCHQHCKYSMLLDHAYLSTAIPCTHLPNSQSSSSDYIWDDKQRSLFYQILNYSSWAICGSRSNAKSSKSNNETADHYSGLTYDQRVKAGHAIKRFIDIGRVLFVRQTMQIPNARLLYYTKRETSPENLMLITTNI